VDDALIAGVELLCLDAGNTIIFLDHTRVSDICKIHGFDVSVAALVEAEGEAKRRAESPGQTRMIDAPFSFRDRPGGAGWGRMVGTMLAVAGLAESALTPMIDALWQEHEGFNLWRKVPDGFVEASAAFRARGGKVVVVSNSEGMLAKLFDRLGIAASLDSVVDSGLVGVEKPDPKIFDVARERAGGVPKERALHLGDVFATDILGARNAGIRCALIDPFGHYTGRHEDVPRVPGCVEVLRAITARLV
jgi:putative hydrolase of the HAD superfamily